jgi:hypothetical protein
VLVERRSRTTYHPTATPNRSTHVDTFTGTTSSFTRTVSQKLAAVGVAGQPVLRRFVELAVLASAAETEGRTLRSYSPQCRGCVYRRTANPLVKGRCSTNETTAATTGHVAISALNYRPVPIETTLVCGTQKRGLARPTNPWSKSNSPSRHRKTNGGVVSPAHSHPRSRRGERGPSRPAGT